ncbi:fumarylacetoacetate hydrolase family protein [Eubacteriales bacterium OttesenSCG-928-M02]|nr:fumarylacetoacetate hydrolase family protein [Eubacteriales bacterium OttesenSCG-928-M02]
MKFLTYTHQNQDVLGVLSSDGTSVFPLSSLGYSFSCMEDWIEAYSTSLQKELLKKISSSTAGIPLSHVALAAPIPHPRHDIICVGHNYLEHAKESMRFRGQEYVPLAYPTYFGKRVNRAIGHGEAIPAHSHITSMLDYESELAVVIGKPCSRVQPADVFSYIFGYTIVNDVTARDLQNNHGGQFYFGKGLDGFTPMGPYLVTADEFPSPLHLSVTSRVNGELRQSGNTNDFIFDIPFLISELSQGICLMPGDIIATGTPMGVGMGFSPPKFLSPGDEITCEIEGIGILSNPIR